MVITIKDVAKMAGVSISTVSRVLNHSKPVSEEIRKRVEKVVEETGYVPNPVARSLVMRKSKYIGVIVSDISNSCIGEYLNGVEEIARMYDYDLLLCNSYGELNREINFVHLLQSKQIAGIIVISYKLEESIVNLVSELKIPAVYISKNATDYDVISVGVDDTGAAYDITKHLLELNHSRIALIQQNMMETVMKAKSFLGYKKALEEYDISIDYDIVVQGRNTSEEGYRATKKLLSLKDRPTAIFCLSDELAVGAMGAIVDEGLSIPKDISVVGYYDTDICTWIRPGLTTVRQPLYDIGASATSLLVKVMENKPIKEKQINLPYEIIERGTAYKNK